MKVENWNKSLGNPLVSIVVITYNSAKYILETLESAKAQTYQNIELIISDDYSQDETVNICRGWLEENGKRFIRTELITPSENTGTAGNLNRGINMAVGEWIKIIAGDDALYPDLITQYAAFIKVNPDVEFLHSKVQHFKENFDEKNKLPIEDASKYKINQTGMSSKDQFYILLRSSLIGTPTVMIKSSVFKKVGLFNERFPLWEDRPMFLKITESNIKLIFLDILGAKYRERSDSVAHTKGNKKLISNFRYTKLLGYNELILKHLSGFERIVKTILIRTEIFFYQNSNKNILPVRLMYKILVMPLSYMISRIDIKYK